MFGSDDITWCGKIDCKDTKCYRNQVHIKDKVGLHSFAMCEGTEMCPSYYEYPHQENVNLKED